MEPHTYRETIARTIEMPYLLRAPSHWTSPARGLVIFLHGAGEKGAPLEALARTPIVHAAPHLDRHGYWLAVPQCPSPRSGWPIADLRHWLDHLRARQELHDVPIILTGISMGGRGCWEFSYEFSDEFSVLIPLCGPGIPNLAPRLKSLAVRIYHGADDQSVPLARSQEMHKTLLKEGVNATLEILPGTGHNIGSAVYGQGSLWEWAARQAESPVRTR